jgi:hypothetical protein
MMSWISIPPVGGGPGCSDYCPIAGSGECAGICGELFVNGTPVRGTQACRFLHEQNRPPFVQLARIQCCQRVRHLRHQGSGETKQSAAAGRGLAPGQGNLMGDALTLFRRAHPFFGLGAALEAIKCHSNPGLQAGYGGLQILKSAQLFDQPGAVGTRPD